MNTQPIDALFDTTEVPGLGPEARSGIRSVEDVSQEVESVCRGIRLKGPEAVCLRALALVWQDHLDEAHGLVQDLSGPEAAWVHGIIHRREPDYSNARYWFHRVGGHEALESMADVAAPILASHAALPFRLIRDGRWDAFAFIDAVAASLRQGPQSADAALLRILQAGEIGVLGRHLGGA